MEKHWFEEAASHMGDAYLNYSFTKGTEQEVSFLMKALDLKSGMKLLDVGCGPGRHSHLFAREGINVLGVDISEEFINIASSKNIYGARFERQDARNLSLSENFDAVISLCQGAFGLAGEPNKPVPFLDPDGEILIKMADALVDGGRLAVSAFSAYFQMHYLENSKDTFYADHGVNHENASIRNMCGEEISQELWTSCFTPRELRLFAKDANLSVENIWSVAPGKYMRSRPTHTKPELLMIARRENCS